MWRWRRNPQTNSRGDPEAGRRGEVKMDAETRGRGEVKMDAEIRRHGDAAR